MKQAINFSWRFVSGFEEGYLTKLPDTAEEIDIPHSVKTLPINYFSADDYQGLFTYEKVFDIPGFDPNQRVLLDFEGAMLKCRVYLNGTSYGQFISGFLPFAVDVTSAAKANGNRLVVVLDTREDPLIPPFGKAVDYLTFGGIYRPVYVETHPKTYLSDLFASGSADGQLSVEPTIVGPNAASAKVAYELYLNGERVFAFEEKQVKIAAPSLWTLQTPNLYVLRATLTSSDGTDAKEIRFGFRDAKFTREGFFLNGEKIKLVGLNRHQNYPYVGAAMPAAAQYDDAELLRRHYGVNLVRTSHYADSESFLDRCDEIGLMLIDEIPGWQFVSTDPVWRATLLDFMARLVKKERNHPCLIAYGDKIDESRQDDELEIKCHEIAHRLDPSRQTLGVRNYKRSVCHDDVYAFNDFSCSGDKHGLDDPKSWKAPKNAGLLVTEHNGHMFPTKSFDDNERRVEQALRHARVLDDAYKYRNLAGAVGWCAFDYNTHKDFGSGDHICYHGVSDIFRNSKHAAYLYASQSELPTMWVSSPIVTGDVDEALLRPVYVFTNCDYVELYRNARFIGIFYPDRKNFPHLPHAPILVDDFIGDAFDEPRFKKGDWNRIKKAMNYAAGHGLSHLSFAIKLSFAALLMKYHLSFDDMTNLYSKYIASWGEKAAVWTFRGITNAKPIFEKKFGPSTEFSYRFSVSSQSLANADTYDVARVSISFVDQYGTQLPYSNSLVSFETHGPIKVIGPTTVALVGGAISVYVRTLEYKHVSEARLIVKTDHGDFPIDFALS